MMGGLVGFLFIYLLGGLTFLPLLIVAILLHAYLTFPTHEDTASLEHEPESVLRSGDDVDAIERAKKTLGEKFQPRSSHDADVAAGYFAVCREYVPGGVNGKPPERNTPLGSTVVSTPSQSVYQSMYRSIFDRKPNSSPLDNKGVGKPQKKGGNVFYVVLRHGHLMLFDDDEQLEVRHVVSLAHHDVSIYSGGGETPEGELFIKRNALCLSRKLDEGELTPDGRSSKPFFLFSDNCSDKEDFYFALLRNQEKHSNGKDNLPVPLQYEIEDIITLVQRLHSSEEHLQTRWINAVIGRVFLALYKTPEVENFVRAKITKKISRVKTPSFLSKILLKHIDMGGAAPVITNPRLKDLTVDGELVVEADFRYTGNFRLEVAATARIELGTRFKAREVNLLLAVVLKRIEGHVMVRVKPPPSNRFWFTFQTMPKIDMTIEPIVSSRQITYTLILRQIENRIKEVVAESLVFPNWDDSPFHRSEGKLWRGGIWADEQTAQSRHEPETAAAQGGNVEEVQHLESEREEPVTALPELEKSMSTPVVEASPPSTAYSRKANDSAFTLGHMTTSGSSSSIEMRSSDKPRALRSGSLAGTPPSIASIDVTNADAIKESASPEHSHAASAMAAISALSQAKYPVHTPVGSPSPSSRLEKSGSQSSVTLPDSVQLEKEAEEDPTPQPSLNASDTAIGPSTGSHPPSPTSLSHAALPSEASSMKSLGSLGSFGNDSRRENSPSSSGKSSTAETKRLSLAAVTNVASNAKKWGWNAIQRRAENRADHLWAETADPPSQPLVMGRGRPLPPPGTPLPRPDKKTRTAPIPVPKRKPLPPPLTPEKHNEPETHTHPQRHAVPPPPLPKRRTREDEISQDANDGIFVIAAPRSDSEPTTPMSENAPSDLQPSAEEGVEDAEVAPSLAVSEAPRLPKRRTPYRVLSSSPVEDGPKLPAWMAAQEEEARVRSTLVDEDMGL